MNVHSYSSKGGKDLIRDYLDKLPTKESAEGYFIIEQLEEKMHAKSKKGKRKN